MNNNQTNISVYNLMILLYNVYRGSMTKGVGFEDANHTLKTFTKKLNDRVRVDTRLVESALWSCNLLDEKKKFWHPSGYNFKHFSSLALNGRDFNRQYNWIEDEK